jgi:hypothetical protein
VTQLRVHLVAELFAIHTGFRKVRVLPIHSGGA